MKPRGFTLIELLVVIAIIGMLSSVVLGSLNSARGKAQDARRLFDMRTVGTALALYYSTHGRYPASNASGCGGWESTGSNPSTFVAALVSANLMPSGMRDPNPALESTCGNYAYYRYPAGYNGCTSAFYVLGFRSSNAVGTAQHPGSPGFSCPGYNWQGEFSWVSGQLER